MNKWKSIYHSYHPVVWTLLFGTMFTNMAYWLAVPFLAVYLSRSTELSPVLIGIAVGAGPLASTFGGFIGGNLSDRYGRKKIMLSALFVWVAVFVGFALAKSVALFVVLNALNGFCRSFFEPSSQALMAEATPGERRSTVFSMRYTAINIGATVGPMCGALLYNRSANLAFFITAAVYFVYGLVLLYMMGRLKFEGKAPGKEKVTFASAFRVIRTDVSLRFFIFGSMLTNLGYSQITSTLPQYLQNLLPVDGIALFSLLMSFNAIVAVFVQMPLSYLVRKRSLMEVMCIGTGLFTLGYWCFCVAWNWWTFLAAMFVLTLGEVLVFPNNSVFIDQLAEETGMRGTYFGASQFRNVANFAGPSLGGYLLAGIGGHWLFGIAGVVVASSALFFLIGQRHRVRKQALAAQGMAQGV